MKYVYIEMVSFIKTNIQNKDNHNDNQNNCILYNKSDELMYSSIHKQKRGKGRNCKNNYSE